MMHVIFPGSERNAAGAAFLSEPAGRRLTTKLRNSRVLRSLVLGASPSCWTTALGCWSVAGPAARLFSG